MKKNILIFISGFICGIVATIYNIKRYDFTVILYARFPQYYIDNQLSGFETIDSLSF